MNDINQILLNPVRMRVIQDLSAPAEDEIR